MRFRNIRFAICDLGQAIFAWLPNQGRRVVTSMTTGIYQKTAVIGVPVFRDAVLLA